MRNPAANGGERAICLAHASAGDDAPRREICKALAHQ
jgi:hypothetical protein